MEKLSALLALCWGNPSVSDWFPSQWASNTGFDGLKAPSNSTRLSHLVTSFLVLSMLHVPLLVIPESNFYHSRGDWSDLGHGFNNYFSTKGFGRMFASVFANNYFRNVYQNMKKKPVSTKIINISYAKTRIHIISIFTRTCHEWLMSNINFTSIEFSKLVYMHFH